MSCPLIRQEVALRAATIVQRHGVLESDLPSLNGRKALVFRSGKLLVSGFLIDVRRLMEVLWDDQLVFQVTTDGVFTDGVVALESQALDDARQELERLMLLDDLASAAPADKTRS